MYSAPPIPSHPYYSPYEQFPLMQYYPIPLNFHKNGLLSWKWTTNFIFNCVRWFYCQNYDVKNVNIIHNFTKQPDNHSALYNHQRVCGALYQTSKGTWCTISIALVVPFKTGNKVICITTFALSVWSTCSIEQETAIK